MARDIRVIITGDAGDLMRAAAEAGVALKALNGQADTTRNRFLTMANAFKFGIPILGAATVAVLGLTGNIGALAPLLGLVTTGLGLLLTPLTAFAALIVALLGPLSVLFAVLGGLGLGAILGFQSALKSAGPQFAAFRKGIDSLKDSFKTLTHTLAEVFMPWFMSMLPVAKDILGVFQHLADVAKKGGLDAVFKALTHGAGAKLNQDFLKIIGPIGDVIAKTIAFAFGAGGRMGQSFIASDFHHFTGWVDKAFEPIEAWFNKQHFMATGMRWGIEIAQGIANTLKNMLGGRGIALLLGGAGAGAGIGAALGGPIGALMGAAIGAAIGLVLNHYWPKIAAAASHVWNTVKSDAMRAWNAIGAALVKAIGPGAWHQIQAIARDTWSILKALGVAAFHIVIDAARILWATLKTIWNIIDTLIVKTGAWKVVVGAVQIALNIVLFVIRIILDVIRFVLVGASHLATFVSGKLVSAWNAVLSVVNDIVGAIQDAIGWAKDLVGWLGQGGSGPVSPKTSASGGHGHSGLTNTSNLTRSAGSVTVVHIHAGTLVHQNDLAALIQKTMIQGTRQGFKFAGSPA